MRIPTLFVLLLLAAPAYAACVHNGVSYPTGTVLGPLICSPGGTWQPRR